MTAGAEAPTSFGRAFQRLEKTLGKNAKIKEIIGTIALTGGVASGAAAPIGIGLGTVITGKALLNAVKNPKLRIKLGELIKELSKAQIKASGSTAGEINALKQEIQRALNKK